MNLISGINKRLFFWAVLTCTIFSSCNNLQHDKDDDDESAQTGVKGKIEVRVISPSVGTIVQFENLNATTEYLLNASVHAPIAGYIRKINLSPGQVIKPGDILFTIESKEAAAMNIIKDTSLHIRGTVLVKATEAGIVKTMSKQVDDYVQEGDELCILDNSSSLVFMLDVPFELRKFIKVNEILTVTLPDGESVKTTVSSIVPEMDKTVQMEKFILRSASALTIPAGLIANVKIPVSIQKDATILPKSAVLCDETQVQFWVMKLLNDSTAVKTPIEKGIQANDSVQIKSPVFTDKDMILISGNYSLPDTASVKVIK